MARQSKSQKRTIERVMHEYKHGELESGSGRKVRSPGQAIAIALSEAGASNRQSLDEQRNRRRQTKRRKARGQAGAARRPTGRKKAELYAEARRRGIPGRSRMSKAELARAVGVQR